MLKISVDEYLHSSPSPLLRLLFSFLLTDPEYKQQIQHDYDSLSETVRWLKISQHFNFEQACHSPNSEPQTDKPNKYQQWRSISATESMQLVAYNIPNATWLLCKHKTLELLIDQSSDKTAIQKRN